MNKLAPHHFPILILSDTARDAAQVHDLLNEELRDGRDYEFFRRN